MTHADFEKLLERRLERTRFVLARKSAEYSTTDDKLHNFKAADVLCGEGSSKALLGMLVKHWVSIQDLVRAFANGEPMPDEWVVDEKITDAVCYLCLLEAVLFEERHAKKQQPVSG